jgi:tetratricopeptide (TPR) repeat protein
MSTEEPTHHEEDLLPWLVAGDMALAAGGAPQYPSGAATPPELRPRLEGDLACIQILRQVLPHRGSAGGPGPAPGLPFHHLARFEIRRELGHGTFGMVFLAWDPQLGREVALKVPRPEALVTAELRERFVREARAAAALDHPHLVPVYEAGEVGPICYIASAYCPGITLTEWLKEQSGPVPLRLAAWMVATLAAAMQHAHERGVVHRDLKPSNVLLQRQRPDGADEPGAGPGPASPEADWAPRITDFGLAKLTADAPGPPGEEGAARTQTGAVLGTPTYMAPEQASGKTRDIGPAADVYALGVILYELLTGRPPFRGETTLDTLEQVRSREPLPPSRLRPRLSRDLETICLKCLQKEPRKRYGSAAALADDLGRYLAGTPIQARPIQLWERGMKWARRRPALAALLAVSGGAAAALMAVVLAYNARLEQRNRQLTGALGEAQEQRGYAEEHLRLARQVVDKYVNRVSDDPRLHAHDLEDLRKDLLQSPVAFYQQVADRYSADPAIQAERGQAYYRLGLLSAEVGSTKDALGLLHKAIAIVEGLVQAHPTNASYRRDLATYLTSLGVWSEDAGQLDAVEPLYERALKIRTDLVREQPASGEARADLARSYNNLGVLYRLTGRIKQAEAAHEEARAIRERLVRDYPKDNEYQNGLANSYTNLGNLYRDTGRWQRAAEAHGKVRDIRERLTRDPATRPDSVASLAKTHANLTALYSIQGRWDLAEAPARAARDLWATLAQDHPSIPGYQDALAKSWSNLASVYQETRHPDLAEAAYRAARDRQASLVLAHATVPEYRSALAVMHRNLGGLYKDTGRPELAIPCFREAHDLRQKLMRDYPKVSAYKAGVADTCNDLGELYRLTGRPDLADQSLTRARSLWEDLVRDHPSLLEFADGLGATYGNSGSLAVDTGKPQAAVEWYTKAVRTLGAALKKQPEYQLAKEHLGEVCRGRALILDRLRRHDEALADWERALPLAEGSVRDAVRIGRAATLARLGEHARAAAEADALGGQQSLAGRDFYNLACVYALAAAAVGRDAQLAKAEQDRRAEQYAGRAVGLLKKAAAAGLVKTAAEIEEMRKAKDLEPLRQRKDFQELFPMPRPKDKPKGSP